MKNNSQGLTLIEVIIGITLMAFVSLLMYGAINRSYKLKQSLDKGLETQAVVPAVLGLLQRDISQMYSPHVLPKHFVRLTTPVQQSSQSASGTGAPLPPQSQIPNTPQEPGKSFAFDPWPLVGEKDKIAFVATSARRSRIDDPTAEFQQVAYFTRQSSTSKFLELVRVTSQYASGKLDVTERKDSQEVVVYDYFSSFQIQYCFSDRESCEDRWDSSAKQSEKKPYPDFLKFRMEFVNPENPESKKLVMASFSPLLDFNVFYDKEKNPFLQMSESNSASPSSGGNPGSPSPAPTPSSGENL